jgi:hypothetical protein
MRVHKNAAKAAALRSQIKQIWIERAQAYPLEAITATTIRRLLPRAVGCTTVRRHMAALRLDMLIRRTKRERVGAHSGEDPGAASPQQNASIAATDQSAK